MPILDMRFDSGTLSVLRAEVRVHAGQAGLPEARAEDVMLAVHELATNAILYGGGAGRLRIWTLGGELHCQVDDGHPAQQFAPADSLPAKPGHGLWVVRQLADRIRILPGACGTRITVSFALPRPALQTSSSG